MILYKNILQHLVFVVSNVNIVLRKEVVTIVLVGVIITILNQYNLIPFLCMLGVDQLFCFIVAKYFVAV